MKLKLTTAFIIGSVIGLSLAYAKNKMMRSKALPSPKPTLESVNIVPLDGGDLMIFDISDGSRCFIYKKAGAIEGIDCSE